MDKKSFLLSAVVTLALFSGCRNTNEETIKREIKVREARRGHDLMNVDIKYDKNPADTFAVYYKALIKVHEKDSTINDSLFFINADGTLLPFITSKE